MSHKLYKNSEASTHSCEGILYDFEKLKFSGFSQHVEIEQLKAKSHVT